MSKKSTYQPEWISADDAARWLGVTKMTLYNWRKTKGLAHSIVNGSVLMYDRKQINAILNENSTYAITGNMELVA